MRKAIRCAVFVAVAMAAACSSGPPPPDDAGYESELAAARAEKDRSFREDAATPVPKDKRDALLPLKYFPVDLAYRVPAALKLRDERPVFEMPTSTGTLRRYQLVGTIEFTLNAQPMS